MTILFTLVIPSTKCVLRFTSANQPLISDFRKVKEMNVFIFIQNYRQPTMADEIKAEYKRLQEKKRPKKDDALVAVLFL